MTQVGLHFRVDLPCILKEAFRLFTYGAQSLPLKRVVICLQSGEGKNKIYQRHVVLRRINKKEQTGWFCLSSFSTSSDLQTYFLWCILVT